ncbi:MAG: fused MFS/spermidine synthase [Gemmataceae bacterium]|nr:fused MFS/spermidine synthase [Gemmataceae bacterium]
MPLLFAVTLFLSASLLFMVQPMVGKMVLPLLGGSPAVWNACMVFFQALLLLGYLYAHRVTQKLPVKRQWMVHTLVLGVPVAVMLVSAAVSDKHTPIAVAKALAPTGDTSPFLSVMALLTLAIGVPFFVSSTSAPLIQKWFADTGHPAARDPYFLYAASNAGSLISLLGYPLVIEPGMEVVSQTWVWALGFVALAGFIFACGRAAANPVAVPPALAKLPAHKPGEAPTGPVEPPPTGWRKAKWVMLAFVPSSLMLGVTFHMTTDIASIPLLWVGPLALYLVTFIIAFSTILPPWFRLLVGNGAPVMILLLVFVIVSGATSSQVGLTLLLHLLTFFAAALMCHYELARDRPGPAHLTGYFLLMSLGGVLGGLFNALFAPLVFAQDYEYKLALVFACFMVPTLSATTAAPRPPAPAGDGTRGRLARWWLGLDRNGKVAVVLDALVPVVVGLGAWGLYRFSQADWFLNACKSVASTVRLQVDVIVLVVVFAIPVMVCFFFVDRPVRFGLCVAVILGMSQYRDRDRDLVYSERSFFGILKVEKEERWQYPHMVDSEGKVARDENGKRIGPGRIEAYRLVHGTTLHGTQIRQLDKNFADYLQLLPAGPTPLDTVAVAGALDTFDMRQEPLTYYHRTGPVGAMFRELRSRKGGADAKADFAMVGLGTGSVSCYALPGQKLTFYEIDPAVKRLVADDDKYFTYVKDAERRGAKVEFRMGDARLKLQDEADAKYALLLVDAFSSDSIPVHLLTREAVELYFDRMTPDGILALHISNKFVRLEPVVARIAADLNATARVWNDDGEGRPGKTASSWVVLARKPEYLGDMAAPQPRQVEKFIDDNLPLLDLYRRHGGEAKLLDVLKAEHGQRAEAAVDLFRHYKPSAPLKLLLKAELSTTVVQVGQLRAKYGPDTMFQAAIAQENTPQANELRPLLKGNEAAKLQKVWEDVGGPRVELLRDLIAKYGAGDPEPTEGKDEAPKGTALNAAVMYEFGPKFLDLAQLAAGQSAERKIQDALLLKYGDMFRELRLLDDVPTWTDDYSDVLRVMMIPELQKVRKFLGLKTPVER